MMFEVSFKVNTLLSKDDVEKLVYKCMGNDVDIQQFSIHEQKTKS